MKRWGNILAGVVLMGFAYPSGAGLFEDLAELKKICDAKLLTEAECTARRQKILAAHDGEANAWFCNYAGEAARPAAFTDTDQKQFSESASASSVVKEILDEAGLAPNFIVRPANVPNAAASARGGQRYIEYNPSFVSQLKSGTGTNWSVYSVMAHEIGHHLQGHTLQAGGSRPDIELEADEYSGFILAKLGASLDQAQKAMQVFGSDTSAGTHPAKPARLQAIQAGWSRGSGAQDTARPSRPQPSRPSPAPSQPPSAPPAATAYTDSCIVNGEAVVITAAGAILSRNRGYMQVGQKVAPAHPNCAFDMVSNNGRYCVTRHGSVHFGTPQPVGRCQPCRGNSCN